MGDVSDYVVIIGEMPLGINGMIGIVGGVKARGCGGA